MTKTPNQEQRRERLKALLAHADFGENKSELARVMGWKGGAYVRQLVAGERPITEKTVLAIEAARGGKYRGWFASAEKAPAVPTISEQDEALLDDLHELLPEEQEQWRSDIRARAEFMRRAREWRPSDARQPTGSPAPSVRLDTNRPRGASGRVMSPLPSQQKPVQDARRRPKK